MARKIPQKTYSAQGLNGHVFASGSCEVNIYRRFPNKNKEKIGTETTPIYSFIDAFGRTYALRHCDIEVIIVKPVVVKSRDGAHIEAEGLRGLLINALGGIAIQLLDQENKYISSDSYEFPSEGLDVQIVDIDAFVWDYGDGTYAIDYSPTTLGCEDIMPNRFECSVK